jgi:hypothetical protein
VTRRARPAAAARWSIFGDAALEPLGELRAASLLTAARSHLARRIHSAT